MNYVQVLLYMNNVVTIGKCISCQAHQALTNMACSKCISIYGEKCGAWIQMIIQDPDFKRMCYEALKTAFAKQKFIEKFGAVA
jgi:hypothetical protein